MDGRKPRLLACDLDGTLLDETGVLRPAVIAAVGAVRAAGIHVVLATGRNPWAVADIACALGLTGPQIVMNGGALMSPVTSDVAWARRLDPELALEAIALARDLETSPLLGFLDGHARERAAETTARPDFAVGPRFRHVDTIEALAGDGPIRVYLPTPPEIHAGALAAARDRFGSRASIVHSDEFGFEVMPPETNKGEALRRVATAMGVSRAEVAAIGDGPNDREMFAFAGRSAALLPNSGSAVSLSPILGLATQVVPRSADDGAVKALQLFFPHLDLELVRPRRILREPVPAVRLVAGRRPDRDDDPGPNLNRTAA